MVTWIQEFVTFIKRWSLPVCLTVGTSLAVVPAACAKMDMSFAAVDVAEDDRRGRGHAFPDFDDLKNGYRKKRATGQTLDQLGLDERVVVHTDSENVRDLIDLLAPPAWRVQYDASVTRLSRRMVFHAETTRKRALDKLCSSLGLKGIFYPRRRLILIVDEVRQ